MYTGVGEASVRLPANGVTLWSLVGRLWAVEGRLRAAKERPTAGNDWEGSANSRTLRLRLASYTQVSSHIRSRQEFSGSDVPV